MRRSSIRRWIYDRSPSILRGYIDRVEGSQTGLRIARGAMWSLVGVLSSRVLGLVSSVLVVRMLGRVGYGELGVIQTTISMFGVFAGLGMGMAATKYVAEFRRKDTARAGRILALSSVVAWTTSGTMTLALVVFAPWLAIHTLAAPHLVGLLRAGSLLLLLLGVSGAQTGALAGFEAFQKIAKVNLIVGLITFPLMVGGVYWFGLDGAVWAYVATQAVNCVLNYVALKQEARRFGIRTSLHGCLDESGVLWKYSLPAVLSGALVGPVYWACSALLVNRPNGYAEMGIFNVANQWRAAFVFLPSLMGEVMVPILSERTAGRRTDVATVWPFLAGFLKANLFICLPVLLIFCAASPLIMASYGPAFRTSWPVFVLVQCAAFMQMMQSPIVKYWQATAQMWTGFAVNIVWGSVLLGATYALVSKGAFGLGLANVIAFATSSVLLVALIMIPRRAVDAITPRRS